MDTSFARLAISRAYHCAVTLNTNEILITGGISAQETVLATAEILNPTRGKSTRVPSSHIPRAHHSCLRLSNGVVLLIGGIGADGNGVSPIDAFDPDSGSFSFPLTLQTPRAHATAVLLANETILVTGGLDNNGNILNSAELIDLAASTVTVLPSTMHFPRMHHQALTLIGGSVLISGGAGSTDSRITAEVYDPAAQRFSAPIPMATERVIHTLTALTDGRALTFSNGRGEVYAHSRGQFQPVPGSGGPSIREGHSATRLQDGQVLILGGGVPEDDEDLLGAPVLYNPASATYQELPVSDALVNRADHTATRLPDGRVLVTGGRTLDAVATHDIVVFDPQQSSFHRLAQP
jgi:hypothetical protein